MSEKFTGVWIPVAVFKSDQLTTSAKLLYGVVAGLDGDDGCYASNAFLQRLLGVSERGVQVILHELEDHGLIQRVNVNGRRVIRTVEAIALDGCKRLRFGGEENCGGGMNQTAGEGCRKLHPDRIEDRIDDKPKRVKAPKTPDFMHTKQPAHMAVPEFSAAWHRWVQYAFPKMKVPYLTYLGQLEFLDKMDPHEAVECIEQSIRNGWKGLFPVRKSTKQTKPLTKNDHEQF